MFNGLTNRRDPSSGLTAPILKAVLIGLVPVSILVLSTELPLLRSALLTVSLTGGQWLAALGLSLLLPLVVETSKWVRRRRSPGAAHLDVGAATAPDRARASVGTGTSG